MLDTMKVDAYLGQITSGWRGLLNEPRTQIYEMNHVSFSTVECNNNATFPTNQWWPRFSSLAKNDPDDSWVVA